MQPVTRCLSELHNYHGQDMTMLPKATANFLCVWGILWCGLNSQFQVVRPFSSSLHRSRLLRSPRPPQSHTSHHLHLLCRWNTWNRGKRWESATEQHLWYGVNLLMEPQIIGISFSSFKQVVNCICIFAYCLCVCVCLGLFFFYSMVNVLK